MKFSVSCLRNVLDTCQIYSSASRLAISAPMRPTTAKKNKIASPICQFVMDSCMRIRRVVKYPARSAKNNPSKAKRVEKALILATRAIWRQINRMNNLCGNLIPSLTTQSQRNRRRTTSLASLRRSFSVSQTKTATRHLSTPATTTRASKSTR